MKKTCFILSLAGVAALAACSTQELESPANLQNGMLMVRPIMPEVEIETKADLPTIYAFIPEELNAGTVNPVLPKINSGNTYYYNLEGVGSDVVFSNQDLSYAVSPRYDENGFSLVKTDQYSADLGTELLFGVATGIQTGNTEPYEVRLNRFSSSVQFKFMAYDTDGNELPAETFQYADATLGGFATELRFGSDITTSAPAPYGNTSIAESAALQDGQWLSTPRNVIPGTEQMDYDVNITLSDGTSGNFKGSLGRTLEANHSYIITFRMKKANGSASFTLEEPEIYENDYTLYPSEQKMFRVKSSYAVGKDEGSTVSFHVSTEMPYGWSYELMEGSEYFTVTRDNDELTVTALSTNEAESRTGLIMLRTTEGHEQPVYISQMNGSRQVIYLTKHDNKRTEFTITGSNIEIDYGGGFIPYDDGGNIQLSSDKFANGTTATITADWVSSFIQIDGYKYSYQFENCVTLTELTANIYDSSFDFSNLPALKTLVLDDSDLTEIIFSEGQGIENLSLRNGKFTALNLNNIAGSLKKLDCDSNTSLASLEIYPSDYTGERLIEYLNLRRTIMDGLNCSQFTALKDLDIDYCDRLTSINLTGCSSLTNIAIGHTGTDCFVNINNCSSLKELTILEGANINRISHSGTDIETISNNGNSFIADFDFSNEVSLKEIRINAGITATNFNISNCPNLKLKHDFNNNSSGHSIVADYMDISECTALDTLVCQIKYSCENTNASNLKYLELTTGTQASEGVFNYNFSQHPALEHLEISGHMGWRYDTHPVDLSVCSMLKYFRSYQTYVNQLILPQSIEKLVVQWEHYLESFDISGYTNLKEFIFDDVGFGDHDLRLSGCSALQSADIQRSAIKSIDFTGCQSLIDCKILDARGTSSITLDGCSNLLNCSISSASNITSLDFSSCTSLKTCEVSDNSLLYSVNLANLTYLETADIFNNQNLNNINLANCHSLKCFNSYDSANPTLESIDLSGCSAIEEFRATEGRLTSLDFSASDRLSFVNVKGNLMEADGLDAMLNSLCDRSFEANTGQIYISGNPGENECNKNIALDKNWYFPAE